MVETLKPLRKGPRILTEEEVLADLAGLQEQPNSSEEEKWKGLGIDYCLAFADDMIRCTDGNRSDVFLEERTDCLTYSSQLYYIMEESLYRWPKEQIFDFQKAPHGVAAYQDGVVISFPFSVCDQGGNTIFENRKSFINLIEVFNGEIYYATGVNNGELVKAPNTSIETFGEPLFGITTSENNLYISGRHNIYRYDGKSVKRIFQYDGQIQCIKYVQDVSGEYLFIGNTNENIVRLYLQNTKNKTYIPDTKSASSIAVIPMTFVK